MDSLLVISDEPALAETLASELPELHITEVRSKDAPSRLQEKKFLLILADTQDADASAFLSTAKVPVVKIIRPVRLGDLLGVIRGQMQNKAPREEISISGQYYFLPVERLLVAKDSDVRILLTEKEAGVLRVLVGQNAPVAREKLLKEVWGYSEGVATHTLETHIYRLRGKLRQASPELDITASEEGGYLLGRG